MVAEAVVQRVAEAVVAEREVAVEKLVALLAEVAELLAEVAELLEALLVEMSLAGLP